MITTVQHNNDTVTSGETDMGRPPAITDTELVTALQSALDWPAIAAVETATVGAAIDGVPAQTVRNRLLDCRDDDDSPIAGLRPGGQGGWVWWLTDPTLYELNGEVTVSEDEAIRFSAGEFKGGKNASDSDLVLVALGAPRDTEDMRIPISCPECDHADMRLVPSEEGTTFVCPDCRAERVPIACPECDSDALRITLDDRNQPVVVCLDCETDFATPPTQAPW
jgi:Zn finger protein HypA/HybF involved in hydrogenase expression